MPTVAATVAFAPMTAGAGESGEIGVSLLAASPPHAVTARSSSTDRCRIPTLMLVLVANRVRGESSTRSPAVRSDGPLTASRGHGPATVHSPCAPLRPK